jgi:predicted helicase
MPINGWGIATRKDYLLVDFSRENLIRRFKDIRVLSTNEAISKYDIKQSPHWSFPDAKRQLSSDTEKHVIPVLFRPFDRRSLYYEKIMIERGDHRFDLMSHLFHDNISFITVRRSEIGGIPQHFYCSDTLSVLHSISAKEGNFVFPLYLYAKNDELPGMDGSNDMSDGKRPNLSVAFIAAISDKLNMQFIQDGKGDLQQTFGPEDIFHYMYAVFHAPTYRECYAEFLKIDFPRLPLTSNANLFRELCKIGARLVKLHLMEETGEGLPSYPQKGNNVVDAVRYTQPGQGWEKGRVWMNQEQYFEGVAPEIWEFHVGGYQVCQKWLKDRKGRALSFEDIEHYEGIVASLEQTIMLMSQIDRVIDVYGGWPM